MGTDDGPLRRKIRLIQLFRDWASGRRDGRVWDEPEARDFLTGVVEDVVRDAGSLRWLAPPERPRALRELPVSVVDYMGFLKDKGHCRSWVDDDDHRVLAEARKQVRNGAQRALLCQKVRATADGNRTDDILLALNNDPKLRQIARRQTWGAIRRWEEFGRGAHDYGKYADEVATGVVDHFINLVLRGKLRPEMPATDRRIIGYLSTIASHAASKALRSAIRDAGTLTPDDPDWLDRLEAPGPIEPENWRRNRAAAAIFWLEKGELQATFLQYVFSLEQGVSRELEDLIEAIACRLRHTTEEVAGWLDEAHLRLWHRAITRFAEEGDLDATSEQVAQRYLAGDPVWKIARNMGLELDEVKRHLDRAIRLLRGLWPVP